MLAKNNKAEIDPKVVAGWHERRGRLLAMLHADPGADWAWLWRVHVKIADYLIRRYATGGDETLGLIEIDQVPAANDPPLARAAPPQAEGGDSYCRPYNNAHIQKAASLEGAAAQELRETLRGRLTSLNATNDKRRATQRPFPPTLPPKMPLIRRWMLVHEEKAQWSRLKIISLTLGEAPPKEAEIEALDAQSLALLELALNNDDAWDLSSDEALSDEEIALILSGSSEDEGASL